MAANLQMIVDVVDANNVPVGAARRADVLPNGLNFRTVHVLLMDAGGKVMLQLLPRHHRRSPSKLGSSVAGYVQRGETYQQAARRKLSEELSISADLQEVGTWPMHDEKSAKFVQLFVGRTHERPSFDRDEIADLISLDLLNLEQRVRDCPNEFTSTFLFVYGKFKSVGGFYLVP